MDKELGNMTIRSKYGFYQHPIVLSVVIIALSDNNLFIVIGTTLGYTIDSRFLLQTNEKYEKGFIKLDGHSYGRNLRHLFRIVW